MREELISVGIDIGTSTTQLIFSRLYIDNMASAFAVPRIEIVDREIIYKSDIYFTPLLSAEVIDVEKVKDIISTEYEKAGMNNSMIATGAAIITGETARKENAREVLDRMSSLAGDFVVATAGPDLESVIAGKGAKANMLSKSLGKTVLNVDIGGGTSNLALFKNSEPVDTGCLDIGGRLIRVDEQEKVAYIAPKIKTIIEKESLDIKLGDRLDLNSGRKIASIMADVLVQAAGFKETNEYYKLLITNKGLKLPVKVEAITFSGGVADCIYSQEETKNYWKYGDIGVLLAEEIKKTSLCDDGFLFKAAETIRATVIGAGSHTTSLSGSTILYTEKNLPIKNLPVIKIGSEDEKNKNLMADAIKRKTQWFNEENDTENVVIAFKGEKAPPFERIEEYAEAILSYTNGLTNKESPLIIVTENDIGKVLGQTLLSKGLNGKSLICLDGLILEDGDYIDIGKPAAEGMVLTVIIKTLVF